MILKTEGPMEHFKLNRPLNRKSITAAASILLFFSCFIFIKYVLPLVWPFILAYSIAVMIYPVISFLKKRLNFHGNAAAILTIFLLFLIISLIFYFIINMAANQIKNFVSNLSTYENRLFSCLHSCCGAVERSLKLDDGVIYHKMVEHINSFSSSIYKKILPFLMNKSIDTFLLLINSIIVCVITVLSVFYISRDLDRIRTFHKSCLFSSELIFIKKLCGGILKAYVRSQLIIIAVISAFVSVGLMILGNKYFLVLGIITGTLDALPLIGVGTILIPMSVYYFFSGTYITGAGLIIIFLISYFIREFLEPRLMGDRTGISPVMSLISIFAGYRLFGFLGMLFGPLIFVFIREIIKKLNIQNL